MEFGFNESVLSPRCGRALISRDDDACVRAAWNERANACCVGTGTFGRVVLVQHAPSEDYFALKMLTISEVLKLKQVDHVKNEKDVLSTVRHPFIVNMYADHALGLCSRLITGHERKLWKQSGRFPLPEIGVGDANANFPLRLSQIPLRICQKSISSKKSFF